MPEKSKVKIQKSKWFACCNNKVTINYPQAKLLNSDSIFTFYFLLLTFDFPQEPRLGIDSLSGPNFAVLFKTSYDRKAIHKWQGSMAEGGSAAGGAGKS